MAAIYSASENGQSPALFQLLVEGMPEPLHPILQDELYRIAREAVGNAFRHARQSISKWTSGLRREYSGCGEGRWNRHGIEHLGAWA